jgi:hypothetical protein
MGLAGTLRGWWSDRKAVREYGGLDRQDRVALARDTGLPEDTLERSVTNGTGRPLKLPRLLDALGVNAAEVKREHPGVMRDLEATCSGCCEQSKCRRDLDAGRAAGSYEAYCPNAVTIDALLAEKAAHPAA